MAQLEEYLGGISLPVTAAYAIVTLAAAAVLWRLAVQWRQHGVAGGARAREVLTLAIVTGVALGVVGFGHDYLQREAEIQRLHAELQERDRMAADLRTRINSEVDAVRAMLAERTVRNIERDTLTAARIDLARFASIKDARISQMLALIDTELEVRALVSQTLQEGDPSALARVYARLSELVPDNQDYRDKASQFAVAGAKETH